jgi:hypothetical protein
MPFFVGDYLSDTGHLTPAQHGSYLLLLLHEWRTGPLPDDDTILARLVGCSKTIWTRRLAPVVRQFFTQRDGKLHQKRLEMERQRAEAICEKRAKNHAKIPEQLPLNLLESNEPTSPPSPSPIESKKETLASPRTAAAEEAAPIPSQPAIQDRGQERQEAAPAPPHDPPVGPRGQVFAEGLVILRELTGLGDRGGRAVLGRLVRDARGDCISIMRAIHRAADERPIDPLAWITKATKAPDLMTEDEREAALCEKIEIMAAPWIAAGMKPAVARARANQIIDPMPLP